MTYEKPLRERAISFAKEVGKAQAARVFKMSRKTLYNWLENKPMRKPGPTKSHKINMHALFNM